MISKTLGYVVQFKNSSDLLRIGWREPGKVRWMPLIGNDIRSTAVIYGTENDAKLTAAEVNGLARKLVQLVTGALCIQDLGAL